MDILVYSGEAFTQTLDLDTSKTEADYSLESVTPRLRVCALGTSASVLTKDLAVDDDTAGTITLTLTDTESATLTAGRSYSWQVVDSGGPTVLADGLMAVMPLFADATP